MVLKVKGNGGGGNMCLPSPILGRTPQASKPPVRTPSGHTQRRLVLFLCSFQPPGRVLGGEEPLPEGSGEDGSSCRTARGAAHRRGVGCSLPLPTGAALPSLWQVATSGIPRAPSRCAVERWTGMPLWGRASPSSGRCQLTPRPPCLCRTDALLLQVLPRSPSKCCWGREHVQGWAARGLPFTSGGAEGGGHSRPLQGKACSFLGAPRASGVPV